MTADARISWPHVGIVVAVLSLLADQISKYIMVEHVMRPEGVVETPYFTPEIIGVLPFFQLRLSWNAGMSFSLFNSGEALTSGLLLAFRVIIVLGLIWLLHRTAKPWLQAAAGLIIGGALGNIIDSIMFGAVADFLDFYWGTWHFPTFNIADACISVGAAMWLLDAVLDRPQDAAQTQEK